MARKATDEIKEEVAVLHPKHSEHIIARAEQEKQFLNMLNAKRLPHALLLTGQKGIGKATFAYRLARFLLAYEENPGASLFGESLPPESLHISPGHPTFRRVISGGHPDLLVLEGDDIKIDDARKVPEFLALTPAESDWRVVIIDSADAMNRNAANALLKTIEEPPSQAMILLVSHNPGILLPTIRSRCRVFKFPKLNENEFTDIIKNIAPQVGDGEYEKWALLSGTSPGIALELIESRADTLYEELLERIIVNDTIKLHSFAERFARKDADKEWQVLKRLVLWLIVRTASYGGQITPEVFLGEHVKLQTLHSRKPVYYWPDIWEKTGHLFSETERLYLDRKQAIVTLVRSLL